MTTEQLTKWSNLAKIVAVLVSIVAFVLGGGFFWNQVWHIPNLVYTVLPTYEVGGQSFGGLVIENRGRATAHDVLAKVFDLNANIEALEIRSDDVATLREGGQGTESIVIWLDRVAAGSSVTIYILSNQGVPLDEDHISITSEEGQAIPVSGKEPGSRLASIFTIAAVAALITVSTAISFFSINYFRAREMEREGGRKVKDLKIAAAESQIATAERRILYSDIARALRSMSEAGLSEGAQREFIRRALETSQDTSSRAISAESDVAGARNSRE